MIFEEDVFPDLIGLLDDDSAEVRANAAGALMFSAITTEGKSKRRAGAGGAALSR